MKKNDFESRFLKKYYIITVQRNWSIAINISKSQNMDFPLYFQIRLDQWEGVILEIPYGLFGVFSPFLHDKHRLVGYIVRFGFDPLIYQHN